MGETRRLPMFPLETVLLPGAYLPLHIFEERYRVMTREVLDGERVFGVVLIERGREVGGGDVRVRYGTTAHVEAGTEMPDGRFALVCRGRHRLRVVEWLPDDPYPQAMVDVLDAPEEPPDGGQLAAAEACVRRAWALLSELGASSPPSLSDAEKGDPAWSWCALAPLTPLDRLALLSAATVTERLQLLQELTSEVASDARRLLAEEAT